MWPAKQIKSFVRKMGMKQNPIYGSLLMILGRSPVWTTKDIAKLTKAGYQNCSTLYACVKQIVDAAGGIPWQLFKKPISRTSKKEKIEEHVLLDRMRRPNPQDGGSAFIKNTLAFYLIAGNSYVIRIGPERGEPRELYYMRPDRVKVLPGTRLEPIRGYRYDVGGQSQTFNFNQILHLKMFHPLNDWYGLSPIEVAAKEIDISNMVKEWNMKLLQNDCRPPGAFATDISLTPEQRADLKEQMKEDIQGYKNVGKPLLLEGGLKWESFAITPKDMDHFNSDKMTSRKICSVYNVAPELIGDSENKTYSNYKEARKALYMETILPLMDYLRDEFNNWLTPAFGDDLWLEYNKDAIEAIREELNAVYERQAKAWWRTINERRASTGDDDIGKAGDVVLIPANMIPLMDIMANIEEE